MVKAFQIHSSQLATDDQLRLDEKFAYFAIGQSWNVFEIKNKPSVKLKDILQPSYENFEYEEGEEYKGIPTGANYLDEDGQIVAWEAVDADNHPGRLKYKTKKGDLLISSLKDAKVPAILVEKNLHDTVFSNGFYFFKVKTQFVAKFLLYVLRSKKFRHVLDKHIYRGIGISAYREKDFLNIRIPLVSKEKQKKAVVEIEKIEKEIKLLKSKHCQPQGIIDEVFAEELGFDWQKIYEEDTDKSFVVRAREVHKKNINIRSGYRWHKLQKIHGLLYKNRTDIVKLGHFIEETKNGWSPQCNENGDGMPVLGIDAIRNNATISLNNPKFTSETRNNIEEFYISQDDFFVSRGNTIDLVALAGVVETEPEQDTIFPDLFIRVRLNKKEINSKYLAFLFNSSVGRLYFKHSAKGKNQTMVKISSLELENFDIPLPLPTCQERIVSKIKTRLETQEAKRADIEKKREKIERIVVRVLGR